MKTTVALRIGDHDREIEVERRGDGWRVVVGDRAVDVSDVVARAGAVLFCMDGRTVEASVSASGEGFDVTVRGRTWRVRGADEARVERGDSQGGDGTVRAPMPGNIVAVRVESGEHVRAGDAVVVLESMKMQNELTAGIDGVVRRVACAPGDQVGFDDVLVEIEPGDAE